MTDGNVEQDEEMGMLTERTVYGLPTQESEMTGQLRWSLYYCATTATAHETVLHLWTF